jgi:co-chaperonin GroES (HSP10)
MQNQLKALGNRVFIIKEELPGMVGSIMLIKKEGEYAPPYCGEVISVGKDVTDEDIVVGAKIAFHDFAGVEFDFYGQKILSLRDTDITGIIEKNVIIG